MTAAILGLIFVASTSDAKGLDSEFRQRQQDRSNTESQEATAQAYALAQSSVESAAGSRVVSGPTKQRVWSSFMFYYRMENGLICRIFLDPPASVMNNGFIKGWTVGSVKSVSCE